MPVLDDRNLDASYRVEFTFEWCEITIYPPMWAERAAPASIKRLRMGKFDIPMWIQNAVRLMDVAGYGVTIPGLGSKMLEAYWIEPDDRNTIQGRLDMVNAVAHGILERLDNKQSQE